MQQRFRVELLAKTEKQPEETIVTEEVFADSADDAMALAIRLLQKDYPSAHWVKIDPWRAERV